VAEATPFAADPPMTTGEYDAALETLDVARRALEVEYTASQTYPRWAYSPTDPAQVVSSDAEAQALGAGWSPIPLGAEPLPAVLTALDPPTAAIGVPSFTLHVYGTGFLTGAVIVFNGYDEPTTIVSATELTTGVNMAVWAAPSLPLPVTVRQGVLVSNALDFTFTEAPPLRSAADPPPGAGGAVRRPGPADRG
jgi:hypothetical protein